MRTRRCLVLLLPLMAGCGDAVAAGFTPAADGASLYYRAVGHGPDTIVVLPDGPGLSGSYLVEPLAGLGDQFTLLIYDLRGRGRSADAMRAGGPTLALDRTDVEAIRASHQLEQLTLLGHGYGAALAVHYAADRPERVRRLLLISPLFNRVRHLQALGQFPYGGEDSTALAGLDVARRTRLDVTDPEAFCRSYWGAVLSPMPVRDLATTRRLAPSMCEEHGTGLRRVESLNRAIYRSLGAWDFDSTARLARAPVLIVQGIGAGRDTIESGSAVWLAAAREWQSSLSDARVLLFVGSPRFPWLDEATAFREAARAFLGGSWPVRALRR